MSAARLGRCVGTFLMVGLALTACSGSAEGARSVPAPSASHAHRVASPVRIAIVAPASNEVIPGSTLHVTLTVSGGTISQGSAAPVSPTVGHLHLYLDGRLISMSYTTSTDLPVDPGSVNSLYAEWVASDHRSFTPRDVTPKVYFAVSP